MFASMHGVFAFRTRFAKVRACVVSFLSVVLRFLFIQRFAFLTRAVVLFAYQLRGLSRVGMQTCAYDMGLHVTRNSQGMAQDRQRFQKHNIKEPITNKQRDDIVNRFLLPDQLQQRLLCNHKHCTVHGVVVLGRLQACNCAAVLHPLPNGLIRLHQV